MGRSKLKVALAAHKGTDFQKLKEKKKYKAALKEKSKKAAGLQDNDDDDEEDDEEEEEEGKEEEEDEEDEDEERAALIDDEASESEDDEDEDDEELGADFIAAMDDSDDSDSDIEMEAKIARPKVEKKKVEKKKNDDDDGEEEDDDEDEQAWSDVDEEDRANLVVRQRETINNKAALTAALLRIRTFAPTDKAVPFSLHQSVTGAMPTTSHPDGTPMVDMADDKVREQALYAQSLAAAVEARQRLRKEGVPFTRPADYFAEMLKDDGHMNRVKAKLVEAATAAKASAEARKQRDLKKFGKKVQVEKMQERAKEKKDTLEKIKSLKRKRSELGTSSTHEADLFDVAVDKELAAGAKKGGAAAGGGARGGRAGAGGAPGAPNAKRVKKNEKYGFGGKKRHSKSGDAMSSGDLSGFNAKRMKGGAGSGGRPVRGGRPGQKSAAGPRTSNRPGKARRKAAAGKR
ncbi:rRNA-processing protein EBP2 [Sporothrix curviconia]|uniref:rRNA-processing protein EBP2 n=1 Tax=Sporothrix curviconia TaxID=1260050 RepID=A0ABP0BY78_9PEZI